MKPLPDYALEIIDGAVFFGCLAWVTILPSIGVLWLLGALP